MPRARWSRKPPRKPACRATSSTQAVYAGSLRYTTLRPEGLRRDRIHCYDLVLPDTVEPVASDGEVEAFELWPIDFVVETLRETDYFKFNVSLVLIDFLLRWDLLPDNEETRELAGIFPQIGLQGRLSRP